MLLFFIAITFTITNTIILVLLFLLLLLLLLQLLLLLLSLWLLNVPNYFARCISHEAPFPVLISTRHCIVCRSKTIVHRVREWQFPLFFTSNLSHRRIRRMSLLSQHLFSLWQEDGIVPASPGVSERWGGLGFWVVFSSARWHSRVVFFGRCCRLIGVGLRRRGAFRGARPSVKSSRRDGWVWLANRWTLLF